MTLKINQMRAARALLNWSQKDLAERADVSEVSITSYESEKRTPHQNSLKKIIQAFELAGIIFTENGIELKNDSITIIEGDDWYLRLLDDVYFTLLDEKDTEFLCLCTDDRISSKEINNRLRKIRNSGVRMRQLVEDDNTYLMGPLKEYRYIPKERFNNYVSLIYGPKVAICTDTNTKAIVFNDPDLSKTWTNVFNLLWDVLQQPKKSDANERF